MFTSTCKQRRNSIYKFKRNTVRREMDINYSNESSRDGSGSSGSSYSEDMNVKRDVNMIKPYAFEPNGFGIFVKF